MTPSEVARLFGVRHVGSRKWWSVKCPAHKDRMASLSITDMGGGKTRLVCFAGCKQIDILSAKGLKWKDLRPGNVSPEIRKSLSLKDQRDSLEKQLGWVIMLGAVEKNKRNYWAAAERNIRKELDIFRCQLGPEKVYEEWKQRMFQWKIKHLGWEKLWNEIYGDTIEMEIPTNGMPNTKVSQK